MVGVSLVCMFLRGEGMQRAQRHLSVAFGDSPEVPREDCALQLE